MEVHNTLGHGFLESVYQEALEEEFKLRKIPYKREFEIKIMYKEKLLSSFFKADFLCYDEIIIELKSIKQITNIHEAQILNYLEATNKKKGLILNFGTPRMDIKRYAN